MALEITKIELNSLLLESAFAVAKRDIFKFEQINNILLSKFAPNRSPADGFREFPPVVRNYLTDASFLIYGDSLKF